MQASPRPSSLPHLPRGLLPLAVAVLLALHFALAVGSKLQESTTSDELVHVTGGLAYWRFQDYRLQPENGNLPQRWAALPAYLQGAKFPDLNQDYWRTSDAWVMGHEFFYETGEDHFPRLMAARAMIALFSVGLGFIVFCWSRALFGDIAGLFSLTLFAFSPNFLAHGALATSDVCMTFFFVASLGAWWRHLHDGQITSMAVSLGAFGLACVAKFSAVLLLPMFAGLSLAILVAAEPVRMVGRIYAGPRAKLRALGITGLLHTTAAILVIWAFYGFRYAAFNPQVPSALQFIRRWDLIEANIGIQGKIIHALASWHALPEAFLYGYSYVIETAQSRAAFLNGDYSMTGWWSFFPWTFILKTTLPLLAAIAVTALIIARRWTRPGQAKSNETAATTPWRDRIGRDVYRTLPLVVLFVVYWAFSLTSHLNIGHRHILPTYPVLFIAIGAIVAAARSWHSRILGLVAMVCAAAQIVVAASSWPHYLAYFNELSGGPRTAYRHLVDSSLDWGQDLPGLQHWLATNATPAQPVYLSYFGTGEPTYYGITARRLVMVNGFKFRRAIVRLEPGIYCISATSLQQAYSPFRGPWTIEYERMYQELRRLEPAFLDYAAHPERQAEWEREIPAADWDRVQDRYELLRFARLCHYLRARNPDAQIGYSINIYRLSAAELDAVVNGDLSRWKNAITHQIELPKRSATE